MYAAKTTVFYNGRSQAVRIPKELRFDTSHVEVRRFGDGLLLEPIKDDDWPVGYFENIRVADAGFVRPDQGEFISNGWLLPGMPGVVTPRKSR